MHGNDTFTSTIPTSTTLTSTSARRPPLWALVGGVVAAGGLTFGIGAAVAQESPTSVPAVEDHQAIAEMARAEGMTGLSPASLTAAPSVPTDDWHRDDAAIADWASAEGLTGLSPASLAPVDD